MTLDEMIQKTARYTGTTKKVQKVNGVYSGDAVAIVEMFIDGFNSAKNKIAREKFELTATEETTLDSSLEIYVTSLPYTLAKIKGISADWEWGGTDVIRFPSSNEGDKVKLYYSYLPNDFEITDLTADFPFPVGSVQPNALCEFAAALYLDGKNATDRAAIWLDRWNDSFNSIRQNRGESLGINRVYSMSNE